MKSVRGTMLGALRCMQTGKNNVRITYRLCQQQRKAEKRKRKKKYKNKPNSTNRETTPRP